jgi:hypothetical protein
MATFWGRCLYSTVTLLVTCLLACVSAAPQDTTGSIAGTVTDPSGAVVPDATVLLKDTQKNVDVRNTVTGPSGDFAFPGITFGQYSVTVEAKGFRKYVQGGVELHVHDKLLLYPRLTVGVSTQVVNVEATPLLIASQNAVASGVVTGTQVRELTINNRVWEQLIALVPGVSDSNSSDQYYVGITNPFGGSAVNGSGFQINGGRREENNFLVDGMDNVDRGANGTLLTYPSVDAISEFRIVRGVYDAELGRSAGGQMNVVTRSGTSALHGDIYEFFRNNVLNANNFFNNANKVAKPILRYHDFGGTVGGPVYIPHLYEHRDKTFFFVSEEFRRVVTYTNTTAVIPTPGMLNGTFLHPICADWANTNGVPGACNSYGTQISNIDPIAAAYVKDIYSQFPAINSGTFNVLSTLRNINNFHEDMVKIDHTFGQRLTLTGKFLRDSIPTIEAGGLLSLPVDNIATTASNSPGREHSLHFTYAASPTFLIDGGFGYSYGAFLSDLIGAESYSKSPDVKSALGNLMPFENTQNRVPYTIISGGTNLVSFSPYRDYNRNKTFYGNVTKVAGSHTVKAGAVFYHYNKSENLLGGPNNGVFVIIGTNAPSPGTLGGTVCGTTGLPACPSAFEQTWANFLLGNAFLFSQSSIDVKANVFDNQFEYYLQDAWRVRPNLTVNFGVRHSFFREPTDASGPGGSSRLSNFDPASWDPAKAPCVLPNGNIDVTTVNGVLSTSACNPNYSPLNGFIFADPPTYNGFKGTKSPYGNKVGKEFNGAIAPRIGIAWDPIGNGRQSIRIGYGIFYDAGLAYANPETNVARNPGFLTSLTFNNVTLSNPTGSTTSIPSTAPPLIYAMLPINYKSPYTQQWSFDVQRQFGKSWLVDLGYFGNNGIHLPGVLDTNAPSPGAWKACAAPHSCTSGPNTIQFTGALSGFGAGGAACNGMPCITSSNTALLNALRPYVGYGGSNDLEDVFTSNYNSLQAQVQKKLGGSSMINIAYTWSHGLTTNQEERFNGLNIPESYVAIAQNYGPNIADRRHVLTANFVWDLPWFRSQKGPIGHVLGGWELSGVQTFQTGLPLTITESGSGVVDTAGIGCLSNPNTLCALRPDRVGEPDALAPHTNDEWFNSNAYQCYGSAAFCKPYAGQTNLPTAGPGSARGPGFWRTDFGVFKNIKFSEHIKGQFRLETFNTFNHTNPLQPGVGGSSTDMSSIVYNKVLLAREPRLIQLGLKLNF